MKKVNDRTIKLLLLLFTSTLLMSSNVYAGNAGTEFVYKITAVYSDIKPYVYLIIPAAIMVIAIRFMAAVFNPKNKDDAKSALRGLIWGILFLVLSMEITYWVAQLMGKDWDNIQFDITPDKIVSWQGIAAPNTDPVNPGDPSSNGDLIAYAKTFLGVPYVWGGDDPSGFDCSGFTKYVFAHFGVTLFRVARDQATQGIPVSLDKLQPGDLLFFDTMDKGYVTHVGIYIGGGQMIHAPKTGDVVKIVPLSNWYTTRLITAKRVR